MSIPPWLDCLGERMRIRLSPVLGWALLLGVITHVAGFLIFRVELETFPAIAERPPFLVFLDGAAMEAGSLANERAQLFDSAPLFIPTRWSTSAAAGAELQVPAIRNFDDYRPAITLEKELWPRGSFGLREAAIESPSDLLDLRFLRPFRTFGQEWMPVVADAAWQSFARVRVVGGEPGPAGADSMSRPLTGFPETPGLSRPAVYTLQLTGDGRLLSRPILLESSGWPQLDEWAIDWLLSPERLASLPGGRLEITFFF